MFNFQFSIINFQFKKGRSSLTVDQPYMIFALAKELLPRVELGTSSLPRMRSTTELKQHKSERRDSNPRPPAWKASALSTELLSRREQHCRVVVWVRMDSNHRSRRQQIYSLPHLATLEHTLFSMFTFSNYFDSLNREPLVGLEPTTAGLQI